MTRAKDTDAPGRLRRADSERNRQRLLGAARELFEEQGHDVALDEVARRAGVGNATLYRNFPTRSDLLVAVYADEVTALCEEGEALLGAEPACEALLRWLDAFVVHVATKRALALASTDTDDTRRTELFDRWHESMRTTAEGLLHRAQAAGDIRTDLTAEDLLALTSAAAATSAGEAEARRRLRLLHHGFVGPHRPFAHRATGS